MAFEMENGALLTYSSEDEEVIIPEGVTSIGNFSFEDCPNLAIVAPCGSFAER